VSVSKESFTRILDLWSADDLDDEPPKFGWLSNQISPYPDTLSLETHIWLRNRNRRPFIELEPTDDPLALEQREGINLARVEEIVADGSGH
jgi:hypothetical protein